MTDAVGHAATGYTQMRLAGPYVERTAPEAEDPAPVKLRITSTRLIL